MTNERKPVLILGIGNILLGDEGIGIRVIEQLREISLPENIELVDGGTAGADLIDILAEREKVIIVDSVQTDDTPGTIRKFTIDDILLSGNESLSMHNIGIPETIFMTKLLGKSPHEVIFFGIKPEIISCTLTLSDNLSRKIPKIIKLVLEEADYKGVQSV